ncbi:tetratricopeptide repeat protein [Halodesulfovibrio sp.]|jgi:tetratricopeptide (TPR) repeat protein|uniref:tetratricopeptide repeat protein n=1 Tax=Halodesulfovibrio sp. TaxID=1912772 RepID=UPI0025DA557B|nr:tetratricopeptide repeat protein [Halodesulfovibrio sp.]MCT4625774.1 tetratricopeptide repeat protein [Halodesulfovibrio sp.]
MKEGVYHTSSSLWIGAGATRRKSISKRYWFARTGPEGYIEVQLLTSNLTPIGDKRLIEYDEFEDEYVFEPGLLALEVQSTSIGSDNEVIELLKFEPDDGTSSTGRKKTPLHHEEREATEQFDKGMSLLSGGYAKQGRKILLAVPEKNVNWKKRHKHLFNGFGTQLRKQREPEIALKHYLKAVELSPNDDHLCYNVARVYYDLRKMADCKRWLNRALVANPKLEPAQKFLRAITSRSQLR